MILAKYEEKKNVHVIYLFVKSIRELLLLLGQIWFGIIIDVPTKLLAITTYSLGSYVLQITYDPRRSILLVLSNLSTYGGESLPKHA